MAIWADATFVWNPGDSVTASFDEVSTNSASGLTEGTFISSPRDGRTIASGQGSRFNGLVGVANPQTTGYTLMAAVRQPNGTEDIKGLWVGDKDSSTNWGQVDIVSNVIGADFRGGPFPDAEWTTPGDTDIHVIINRTTPLSGGVLVDLFVDGALHATKLISTSMNNFNADRITIGRTDDSTPNNSGGGQVFAAACWDRQLTNAEIRAISSDPYSYPNDPTDPDDWVVGEPGTAWETCAFYWSPNHDGDRGKNLLDGGALSSAERVEGSEVTVSSIPGRQYNGTQGSRFPIIPLGASDRNRRLPTTGTLMLVAARPGNTSQGLFVMERVGGSNQNSILWIDTTTAWVTYARIGTGSGSGTNRLYTEDTYDDNDTDIHVIVVKHTIQGAGSTAAYFIDDILNTLTDTQSVTAANDWDNGFSIGRREDSATNPVNFQVFAAAWWPTALSDADIEEILADPFPFAGGGITTDVGTISESDTLLDINVVQPIVAGTISEIDSLLDISTTKTADVTTISESESLLDIDQQQGVSISTLDELESLLGIDIQKIAGVGVSAETDSLLAIEVQTGQEINVGLITELESLISIQADQPVVLDVGLIAELESLIGVGSPQLANITTLAELESLITVGTAAPSTGFTGWGIPIGI